MTLDESQQQTLTHLKRKRGVVKASLTRVRTFVSKFNPRDDAITLLEFRQEELPQINRKFDEIQCEIELLDPDSFEEAEQERENFEKEYYSLRSEIQEIINLEKSHNSSLHNVSTSTAISAQRAYLAPIALPKFDGDILEWESFFDCFKALVHNENMYSPAQKFSYLRSSLSGQSLDIVKGIPMTEANYAIAIKRLQLRYDNKSLVIQSHIRAILDSPCVKIASSRDLQDLHSLISTHVAALEALGQPVNHWDAWLITIVLRKLDHQTICAWQLRHTDTELPKYTDLEEFLAGRCVAFKSTETWSEKKEKDSEILSSKSTNYKKSNAVGGARRALLASKDIPEEKCACCSGAHKLFRCHKFKKLSIGKRVTLVRESRICFNCLSPFHLVENCNSKYGCFKCKNRHNTLLHYENQQETTEENSEDQSNHNDTSESTVASSNVSLLVHQKLGHVFLATAIVLVKDNHGITRHCRAVLDCGSQMNFISRKFARQLQLPTAESSFPISGIGANTVRSGPSVDIQIASRIGNFKMNLSCHILPVIVSQLPSVETPLDGWKIPNEILLNLADPNFSKSSQIDLLIGGGVFFELMQSERVKLDVKSLCLQNSKLGWIVTGELGSTCLLSVGELQENDWKAIVSNEDNSYGKLSKMNQRCLEENQVLKHFQDTATRNEEGRFVLQLPINHNNGKLGHSITMATSRFMTVERRLQQDSKLRIEYNNFMREYLEMGHMLEVPLGSNIPERSCYLPHHAVFKTSSLTTKVRIVFDASAKTSSGLSLNDILMRGPTVQEDIFSILTRFRRHQYVITSDIEKMFRQVAVAKQDWDLQRILWRSDPSDILRTYQLVTVTYGTTPASFMTTQCLVTLAQQMQTQYPSAAKVILKDFYMDDLMTGCETQEGCILLQQEITSILASAKLPLRKWCSNSSFILERISKDMHDPLFTLDIGHDDDVVKSLGLCWKPILDEFQFNVIPLPKRTRLTKRTLLSDLNKVFDPLGFLSPVLIKGKIFVQQLWQLKIDWDTPLSEEIQRKWKQYYTELHQLKDLVIPRKSQPATSNVVEMHGFCDASIEAYGVCIYVRTLDQQGQWHARLLCSKSRVSPLKGATIPRLELSGALLLAQLAEKVAHSWDIKIEDFKFWTDSMVVLAWLNSQTSRLKTFVANRVCQILESTSIEQWMHVKTGDNPADVLSRGVTPQELHNQKLWWQGPQWLSEDSTTWRKEPILLPEDEALPEKRPMRLALITVEPTVDLLNYYSNWRKLVRAAAWLLKFIEFRKTKNTSTLSKYLNVTDIKKAERGLIKRAQLDEFRDELHALKKGKEVSRSSKLKCLYPALGKDNMILVGGRLNNAEISEEQKHPIILPANHKVTRLIFEDTHERLLHGGPQLLLAGVRQKYWPLKGRVMARSVTTRCVTCIRARPKFVHPLMAALPKTRVQPSRPFTVSGVDFAGPLVVRSGVRRISGVKAWVAVFICFSTRAIHLEAVVGLTSGAFIATLRRFMSRRGKCSTIYSDNGTNFVGAKRELASYIQNCDSNMAREGIEWKFNPPSAPHFGGLWESAVKSTKHHLNRTLKDSRLNLEELTTLLCQIEACVNSRPITPLNSDPSEPQALTPGHFLIGGPLLLLPEPNTEYRAIEYLKRWKYVQALMKGFWNRWHREYLPQLQVRGRWVTRKPPLNVGDVVIVKDELMAPSRWKLARVSKTHPGLDGVVRVVTIRLASGTEMKRPTVKLCPLPTEADYNEVEPLASTGGECRLPIDKDETVENYNFQRGEDVAAPM